MGATSRKTLMLLFILFLGFILRSISLNQSLWLDEAINVLAAQKFSLWGIISEYAIADFHPPGYFVILWLWTKFFGISEILVRIPSMIFGILTIYIVFLLGQKLHSKTLGIISALLLAINPLHIYYSQEARMYALATLAVSINMLLFIKLINRDKGNRGDRVIYILSNLLVLVSDYVAYFIFPAQLIILFILKKGAMVKKWFIALAVSVLLGIWWLPVFINQLSVGSAASANLPTWKFVVGGFDVKAIPLTFVKFIIGRINLANKIIYYSLLLPICLLFLFFISRGIKYIKGDVRNLLIIWLGIPLILATLISFTLPIYSYFRLIFILPAFIILIASGVLSFQSKLRYLFLGTILLVYFFSTFVYLFNNSFQREDWRGLINYLKLVDKNYLVYFESSGTFPSFDYYAKNSINAKGALKDFPAKDKDNLINLKTDSENTKDIYLVDYLVDISDPNRLVAKELENLGYVQSGIKDFIGVGFVYHYVKK
ncbi:glycosyltransferase family 39 protein [Candidatus Daviesbacteria bacterium]|nr:glycosyltransferase family 39 protein [Candidatus Daviesbacteria bacterium]